MDGTRNAGQDAGLIPIQTIEYTGEADAEAQQLPRSLADDPFTGDESSSDEGVGISPWRVRTLDGDRLESACEPSGRDFRSRRTRRAHRASRKARTVRGRRARRRTRVAVAFLLVSAMVGLTAAGISYIMELWGGKTIPYVVGLSEGAALEALEAKEFFVSVESVPSDAVEGHVIDVRPASGTRVEAGSAVQLTIAENRLLPNVVGMGREEACAQLETAGATNIRFETRVVPGAQQGSEGLVLESTPSAGSVFMSTDEVLLVLSALPTVPDVAGEDRETALAHMAREGIAARAVFEAAPVEQRLQVVRTEPAVGEQVGEEGVVLYVGDPLIETARLADYYDSDTAHIDEFLRAQGFELTAGYRMQDGTGNVAAAYTNSENVTISFAPDPWSEVAQYKGYYAENVLPDADQLKAVCLSIPFRAPAKTTQPNKKADDSSEDADKDADKDADDAANRYQDVSAPQEVFGILDPTVGETTARQVMERCGFTDLQGSCTQATVVLPRRAKSSGKLYYCCYGDAGKYLWTVFVQGEATGGKASATLIRVTCVPKAFYTPVDLSPYGDDLASYIAYQQDKLY